MGTFYREIKLYYYYQNISHSMVQACPSASVLGGKIAIHTALISCWQRKTPPKGWEEVAVHLDTYFHPSKIKLINWRNVSAWNAKKGESPPASYNSLLQKRHVLMEISKLELTRLPPKLKQEIRRFLRSDYQLTLQIFPDTFVVLFNICTLRFSPDFVGINYFY